MPAFPIPEGLPHHPQISRGQTLAWSATPDCPGGSTGTSRPFAALRAKGAPLRGGSLLWTTWTIRTADAQHGHLTTPQQIATDLERHRHRERAEARADRVEVGRDAERSRADALRDPGRVADPARHGGEGGGTGHAPTPGKPRATPRHCGRPTVTVGNGHPSAR